MKKTLITLLALAGVAAAGEFSSNSYIQPCGTATWTMGETDRVKKDLFSICEYKTHNDVQSAYTAYRNTSDTTGYAAIYSSSSVSKTFLNSRAITLSSLYNESPLDEQVALVSYSFIAGTDSTAVTTNLKVQIYDDSNTLLGTSNKVSYSYDTNTENSYGVGTFTFSEAITLSSSTAYTFKLVDATSLEAYTGNVYSAQFRTNTSSGNGAKIDGQGYNGDYPVISVVTKSIPEPTTATLSLLALAGLAARRRRASR